MVYNLERLLLLERHLIPIARTEYFEYRNKPENNHYKNKLLELEKEATHLTLEYLHSCIEGKIWLEGEEPRGTDD